MYFLVWYSSWQALLQYLYLARAGSFPHVLQGDLGFLGLGMPYDRQTSMKSRCPDHKIILTYGQLDFCVIHTLRYSPCRKEAMMVVYVGKVSRQRRAQQEEWWQAWESSGDNRVPTPPSAEKIARFSAGQRQGYEAEARFFMLCTAHKDAGLFPAWLATIRRTTVREEACGFDAMAHTIENYSIGLQIKSSQRGKERFYLREDRRHIPCIVVTPAISDEDLIALILDEITFIREQKLKADGK